MQKKKQLILKREKLLEVKDEWYKKKIEFDTEVNQKKQKHQNLEKQLQQREENSEREIRSCHFKRKRFTKTRERST